MCTDTLPGLFSIHSSPYSGKKKKSGGLPHENCLHYHWKESVISNLCI